MVIKGIKPIGMKEQIVSDASKKYSKPITAVSVLIPVVVAILFTVRLPNVAPLDFLPPIYASINQCIDCNDIGGCFCCYSTKKNQTS